MVIENFILSCSKRIPSAKKGWFRGSEQRMDILIVIGWSEYSEVKMREIELTEWIVNDLGRQPKSLKVISYVRHMNHKFEFLHLDSRPTQITEQFRRRPDPLFSL
jgi:hypothetical protein